MCGVGAASTSALQEAARAAPHQKLLLARAQGTDIETTEEEDASYKLGGAARW